MLIAHLPAGYILGKLLTHINPSQRPQHWLLFFVCTGAVLPDIDFLYFHLIDNRQHHHHSYWTHYPITWISLALLSSLLIKLKLRWSGIWYVVYLSSGGILHVILDSFAGSIRWLIPFSSEGFSLFTVNPGFTPWWLNFILHWVFLIELIILLIAAVLYRKTNTRRWLFHQ